jgi:hypothetical protein
LANSISSGRPSGHGQAILSMRRPEVVALDLVDAELVERLADIEIALAGGDDADLRIAAAGGDDLVELVGAHEGQHGVALVVVQPRLHAEHGVVQPDVQPALGHAEFVRPGDDDVEAVERAVDHGGRLHGLVHALQPTQVPVKRDMAKP